MKILTALLISFLLPFHLADATDFIDLKGRWGTDCDYNKGLISFKRNKIIMELYPNQAYITLTAKLKDNKTVLYFNEVYDVGRGGTNINWEEISKEIPFAKVSNITKESFDMCIDGLYSKSTKTVIYTPTRAESINKMKLCK